MSNQRWREPARMSPPLPNARIERQWDAVKGKLSSRSTFRRPTAVLFGALGGGLAVAACVGLFVFARPDDAPAPVAEPSDRSDAVSPTEPEVSEHVLSDGSSMSLAAATRVRTVRDAPDEITLELSEGRGVFEVTRRPSREFTVVAGDVEVVVIGTRFSVARDEDTVVVEVERGRVEVRRGGETSVLSAGERWSGPTHRASEEEAALSDDPQIPARRSLRTAERPEPSPIEIERGRALFEEAQAARRARNPRRAAERFGRLIAEYPRDPRAGLAAYELGRLRLDVLGDPRGAAPAFERALALGVHAELRESVRAHLVRAYDATGSSRCARARTRFLSEHPTGTLADDVRARCSTP